jgi:hypothetical protein
MMLADVARAVGAELSGTGSPLEALAEYFADDPRLLILDNLDGPGRYEEALAAAQQADHPQELWSPLTLPELIEAAVRSGHAARAVEALDRLVETTRAAGTDWAPGTEARSRALLGSNGASEDLYPRGDRPPGTH